MAVFTYGANDISFDTFRTWANNVAAQADTSLSSSLSEFEPAFSAPFQASDIQSTDIFYGTITADNGGTVALSSPYTVGATTSISVKNFAIDTYSLTLVAAATYPYTFHSWRDATGGGGTQLSTSATLTLSDTDHTSVTTFYAYFTTSHIDPPF